MELTFSFCCSTWNNCRNAGGYGAGGSWETTRRNTTLGGRAAASPPGKPSSRKSPDARWRRSGGTPRTRNGVKPLYTKAPGTALFKVRALATVDFAEGFTAYAAVDDLVAYYDFGPLVLIAGEETELTGTASGAFVDNCLLLPGEFQSQDARLVVENLTASTGTRGR